MDSNIATLQTIAISVLLIAIICFLPIIVIVSSTRRKKQEREWEFVAKGAYYKTEARRMICGSVFSTIRFTDGTHTTVVDVNLPAPGTYIEVYKTKKGNNFKIEMPIPPSSCL